VTEAERRQRVEDICDDALRRAEEDDRAAFVVIACDGDEGLRQEVEALLLHAQRADKFLTASIGEVAANILADHCSSLAGRQFGVHQMLSLIGAGGMGEVYRAHDTKLNRDVALKVLPESFANDPDRLARFQREAQVLASLNHPNIAAIYGLQECDGVEALVLEFVEGPTLADRIARGPIPLDEALPIAKQIAEALEAAHEQGIIHRDLKPANIKVRDDGTVKVLDFGLARLTEPNGKARASECVTQSPTITSPAEASGIGMILGTAAYMAPEQAKGRLADRRSDIWAFGCVLFEMLTGQRVFTGATISDTMASVIKDDPPWDRLAADTPVVMRRLLRRCLAKEVKQRLQAIGEARIAIEQLLGGAQHEEEASGPTRHHLRRWIALATLLALVAGLNAGRLLKLNPNEAVVWLDVDLGLGPGTSLSTERTLIISPDGARLVYLASVSGGPPRLFSRRLDHPTATELQDTEGASWPFFSPDGQYVGFAARGKLNRISVDGGPVVRLGDRPQFLSGASWGEDSNIIVADRLNGLGRIPADGGALAPVIAPERGRTYAFPEILPGGKAVLFVATTPDGEGPNIEVLSFADHHRKTLVRGATTPHYLPSGHLLYGDKGTLFAVRFDVNRLETRGTAVPVLNGTPPERSGLFGFDVSHQGTLVYRKTGSGIMTVQWLESSGANKPLRAEPGIYANPRLSPDGQRLALTLIEGLRQDVWVYDERRDSMTRLTTGGFYSHPIWSPDGQYLVFTAGGSGMFWARADAAGQPQFLTLNRNSQVPSSFSPDGKRLAYTEFNILSRTNEIWTVPVEYTGGQLHAGTPEPFFATDFNAAAPAFSPDGRWLAYQSSASGRFEVSVQAFPAPASGQGVKGPISSRGGTSPVWSRSGRELLYRSGDRIMTVRYTEKGGLFVAEEPRVWAAKLGGLAFDLALDGKRLAVVTPVDSSEADRTEHDVVFLFNFFDYLQRLVPSR